MYSPPVVLVRVESRTTHLRVINIASYRVCRFSGARVGFSWKCREKKLGGIEDVGKFLKFNPSADGARPVLALLRGEAPGPNMHTPIHLE